MSKDSKLVGKHRGESRHGSEDLPKRKPGKALREMKKEFPGPSPVEKKERKGRFKALDKDQKLKHPYDRKGKH